MRYTFKLIIAGDGGVGKTTLVDRYVNGTFKDNTRITLGVQFMVKRLNIDGNPIDLQIWDFGGEDRFRFILPAYCRGAHGAIFMYDVTNPASLFHIDQWLPVLRSQGGKFPIIMGGTKADLENDKKVPIEEARSVAHRSGVFAPIEVSSKTGQNVDALFENMCLQMMKASRPEIAAIPVKPVTQGIKLISRV
jgi:Ras-related protein Rab-14